MSNNQKPFSQLIRENREALTDEIMKQRREQIQFTSDGMISTIIIKMDGEIETCWWSSNTDQIKAVWNGEAEEIARIKPDDMSAILDVESELSELMSNGYTEDEAIEMLKDAYYDNWVDGMREETDRIIDEAIEAAERDELEKADMDRYYNRI